MAGGGLVPHVLPSGQTIMVPDYLAPKGPGALAMPSVPAPQAGPDMRVAGPGGGAFTPQVYIPDEDGGAPAPFEQQVSGALSGGGPRIPKMQMRDFKSEQAPEFVSVGDVQTRADILKRREEGRPAGKADPSKLVGPGAPANTANGGQQSEGEWNPLVRRVFNEGGGGGGGPRRTGRREESTATVERTPGKELLPELRWAMGLEERPQELDPDAPFVADDPQYRGVQTGVTMGAERAGKGAKLAYEQQVNQQLAAYNAQREGLTQQSQLIDENLAQIAERRKKIAALQETADKRMQEAQSFEPRTRDQVWEEKGAAAQLMGVLAMALGGYAVGAGRAGRNMGFDMVNKVIDDAIEGDRYKAEKRSKVGMQARNDYEKALALYGDTEAATLEAKGRKLANTMGMIQNQLAQQGLSEEAKMRGEQLYQAANDAYLENAQQLFDQLNGVAVKESISYKPEMAGGGGGGKSTLQRAEEAARAQKAYDIITGKGGANPHQRSVEGDKLTELNKAFEAIESAEGVQSDLKALGAESSDIDDPLSGPIDAIAAAVGTGGTGRRARQSLERNTENLARGIQIGASDNDAISADKRARADGSGAGRWATAETAKRKASARIQSTLAGMSPAMRQAYLEGLPPERRALVQEVANSSTVTRRAASATPVE